MDAEARRAEQTPNPDSMDFYFQGRALINRGFAPEMLAKAREFYERALELDPGNIGALVGVAGVDVLVCISDMTDDPQALLAEAEARLIKALAATPNNAYAHRRDHISYSSPLAIHTRGTGLRTSYQRFLGPKNRSPLK